MNHYLNQTTKNTALLTDLYQLTMAYGYFKQGLANRKAVFHLFFRANPFNSGFTIAAGLENVIHYLQNFKFEKSDLDFLAQLKGNDGKQLFSADFLKHLETLQLNVDVAAVEEGTIVFPHEPLLRVEGSLILCQLLETPLLNLVNFSTLIATKAARIVRAAGDSPVLEFGLRRAQGIDGAMTASRSAFIGGCLATSNLLAGKHFQIPVKGTHAHSWVMSFDHELDAFANYAEALPNNCVFLVDTYDTLQGVNNAIKIANRLKRDGHQMIGVRLDSGDLIELSKAARKRLDDAGYTEAKVIASNDLDEYEILRLKEQGAQIDIFGVGTKLVTAYDQPALGGVYKMGAIEDKDGTWQDRIKLSEQNIKTSNPGKLNVKRYLQNGSFVADQIYDERTDLTEKIQFPHSDQLQSQPTADEEQDLLVPVYQSGDLIYQLPELSTIQARTQSQLKQLPDKYQTIPNCETYPVGLNEKVAKKKAELIQNSRKQIGD